jgi:hypothetical protein
MNMKVLLHFIFLKWRIGGNKHAALKKTPWQSFSIVSLAIKDLNSWKKNQAWYKKKFNLFFANGT